MSDTTGGSLSGSTVTVEAVAPVTRHNPCPLSARELQILGHVADGYTNREIGERLHLSALTVKSHMGRIFREIHAADRAHAVAIAMRAGWVQ